MIDTRFVVEQTAGVTVLFALAALASWLLRGQSAASRYFIWCLAIVAALVLPLASLVKPAGAPAMLIAPVQAVYVVNVGDVEGGGAWWAAGPMWLAAWLVGFSLMNVRLASGLYRASRRRRASQISRFSAASGRVEIRLSDRISVPETFGFWRPVILLPVEATEWSPELRTIALAHELVHIQRHDWLTQMLAQFSACVYWFHPMAWFALAQTRKERELACDDEVLLQGYRNSEYAEHLVDIARRVRSRPDILAPSIPMATRSQLESRVRAILDPTLRRGTVTIMTKLVATASTAFAILLFSSANGTAANPGAVSGNITDASRALIPKARVVLSSLDNGKAYGTISDDTGSWEIRSVSPGRYRVEVRRPGFAPYQQQIAVPENEPVRLGIQLAVGSIEDTITVQGTSVLQARPAASSLTSSPTRLRIGGNVQAAKLVQMVRPLYPQHLKDGGVTGTVIMQAVISTDGAVLNLDAISPEVHPDLVEAAVSAVKQWRYEPTLLNGEPVEITTLINVNFTLTP